jgi:hypothetical protein
MLNGPSNIKCGKGKINSVSVDSTLIENNKTGRLALIVCCPGALFTKLTYVIKVNFGKFLLRNSTHNFMTLNNRVYS